MPLTFTPSLGGLSSIAVAGATGAAPAANTTICTATTPDATNAQAAAEGTVYKVSVLTYQLGTPDANYNNMFLTVNGIAVWTLLATNIAGGNAQVGRIVVPAGASVAVVTGNAAGGASAIYAASLILTRLQKGGYPSV